MNLVWICIWARQTQRKCQICIFQRIDNTTRSDLRANGNLAASRVARDKPQQPGCKPCQASPFSLPSQFSRQVASLCTCRPNQALPDVFCVSSPHARRKASRRSCALLQNWKRNVREDTPQSHHPAQACLLGLSSSRPRHHPLSANHLSRRNVSQHLTASLLSILRGCR